MQDMVAVRPDQDALPGRSPSLLKALIKPALLLIGLLAAGSLVRLLLPSLGHGPLDPARLRDGASGRFVFLGLGTLICAVGLPRQAVGFAGGFAYGALGGIILTTIANLAACLLDLLWARLLGRAFARRLLRGRWSRLDRLVARDPFTMILTLRLLPVGSSLMLSLLAGVLEVGILPFLSATLLGSLPQTVIFALVGSGVRIGQATQIVLGMGLFVASMLGGWALLRRNMNRV